jgi:hypothetical protein
MATNNSELWAGLVILLLVLVAAAVFLPPAFQRYGAEWVTVLGEVRP